MLEFQNIHIIHQKEVKVKRQSWEGLTRGIFGRNPNPSNTPTTNDKSGAEGEPPQRLAAGIADPHLHAGSAGVFGRLPGECWPGRTTPEPFPD